MPCPCEGDGNVDVDREHVFLRFIGGRDKIGKFRGRFRTYVTDRIYRTLPEFANFKAYPYWASATEKEFCDQEAARAKAAEEEALASTESSQDDISLSAELPPENSYESDISVPDDAKSTPGLTSEFGGGTAQADLIRGMDDALLKNYIVGNGGTVDGRWGRDKLIQEALKL